MLLRLLLVFCLAATGLLSAQDCSTLEFSSAEVEPVTCFGNGDGQIAVTVAGGVPPYAFSFNGGVSTGPVIPELPAGTYLIMVTDAQGCTRDTLLLVDEPFPLSVEGEVLSQISCNGASDGQFRILVSGGIPPYTLSYSSSSSSEQGPGPFVSPDLSAGLYTIWITDSNGCTEELQITLAEPAIDRFYTFPRRLPLPCDTDSLLLRKPTDWGDATVLFRLPGSPNLVAADSIRLPAGNTFYRVEYDNGCQAAGIITVEDQDLTDIDFRISIVDLPSDDNCAETTAYGVYDSDDNSLQDTVFYDWQWFSDGVPIPDGNLWEQTIDRSQPQLLSVEVISDCDTLRLSLVLDEPLVCSDLSGTLALTGPGCDPADSITVVPFAVVELTNTGTGEIYFAITDSAGRWAANLPTGTYQPRPIPPVGSPSENCLPLTEIVLGDQAVAGVPLYLGATEVCPRLGTGITTARFRRCFPNRATVAYDNRGAATALGATLTVELDEFFTDVTANRPFTRNGQVLTFDLGDVLPFASGEVRIDFTVSCDAEFGQIHCLAATAAAAGDCTETDNWSGAFVTVSGGECIDDEVEFIIRNEGANPMTTDLEYIVVEDGIMMQPRPVIELPLDAGGQRLLRLPANGSTYHVVVQQEPMAPGARQPAAVAEGCGTNDRGGFSTGFGNLFALGNDLAATTQLCRENTGSYDPNEKLGFPMGLNDENDIEPGTRLTYDLYFQNTGTDTAFTVVVRDTLPLELDICSLKLEASSHSYRASLDSNRVLTFYFENILLPDSTTDLAGSQGVVQFTIDHTPALERGDRFRNRAGIYFDFNEPVITDYMNHRIAPEPILLATRGEEATAITLSVFPNPVVNRLNVRLPESGIGTEAQWVVSDLLGREWQRQSVRQAAGNLSVGQLPTGYYLLLLEDGGMIRGRAAFVVAR